MYTQSDIDNAQAIIGCMGCVSWLFGAAFWVTLLYFGVRIGSEVPR